MSTDATSASPRPIVLILAAYYLPGYKAGGPIRTISNLVAALGGEYDFRIITSDHDYGQHGSHDGVRINEWNRVGKATVFYANARARRARELAATISSIAPDIVYVNSFFSPRFSILPLLLRRLRLAAPKASWIIAPRGEFAPGALGIKPLKKRLFMAFSRLVGLHQGLLWQASSEHEALDIQRALGIPPDRIHVAPNLTAPVTAVLQAEQPNTGHERLSVCFLARVCKMKNLAFAIQAVAECRCPVDLFIYGPVEDEDYAAHCRSLVPQGKASLTVTWHGEVPHDRVRDVLAEHDVFFLPTLGENFGHGVFEALAAGVPVLLSDRTPWRDLDAAGVGWVRSLDDVRPFTEALESLASMDPDARRAMRCKALAYAARVAESSEARDATRRLFHAALREGASPASTLSRG